MTVEEAAGGRVISSLRVPRRGALGLGLNSGPARWAQRIPNIAHQLQHPRHQRCPAHFFVCGNKVAQNLLSAHTTGLFVRSFFFVRFFVCDILKYFFFFLHDIIAGCCRPAAVVVHLIIKRLTWGRRRSRWATVQSVGLWTVWPVSRFKAIRNGTLQVVLMCCISEPQATLR